jgi:hypothetical protein|nr:MAG TPA: hypothetical protein [Caudoviricetes sp.]
MLRKTKKKQSASQTIKEQFEQNQEIKIDIDNFLPKFDEVKLSGKNLAQNYVSEFNTGMNIYQCLNYLQGHIGWLVKAVNDVVKKWNKNIEDMIKYCIELSKSEFDKHWVELKPQVIELTKQTTINQFNQSWEELKPELTQYVNNTINQYIDNQDSKIGKMYDDLSILLTNLKNSGAWTQTGDTIFDGHMTDGRNIATGNINIFGGSVDGGSYIRTNSGSTENDLAGGV